MKIPFNIEKRPDIESGKYRVETMDGHSVRIICWDKEGVYPIVGLVKNEGEKTVTYSTKGELVIGQKDGTDLILVNDEPEYTVVSREDEELRLKIRKLIENDEDSTTFEERRQMIAWLNEQKPAEWSKESEKMIKLIVHFLQQYRKITHYPGNSEIGIDAAISWLKSLHS